MIVLARRTSRIGVQWLTVELGLGQRTRFYASIRNRTYASRVEVPSDRVPAWLRQLA